MLVVTKQIPVLLLTLSGAACPITRIDGDSGNNVAWPLAGESVAVLVELLIPIPVGPI